MHLIVRLPPQAPCRLDQRLALLLYDWGEVRGFDLLVVEGEVVSCFWEEVVEGAEKEEGWGEETDGEGAWEGGSSSDRGIVTGSESRIRAPNTFHASCFSLLTIAPKNAPSQSSHTNIDQPRTQRLIIRNDLQHLSLHSPLYSNPTANIIVHRFAETLG
jgi:hypothetical protein